MTQYRITLAQQEPVPTAVYRWCLDTPKHEQSADLQQLAPPGLAFRGWVLWKKNATASLVLLCGDEVIPVPLQEARPDVIRRVLYSEDAQHPQRVCGFSLSVSLSHAQFQLGVVHDGAFQPLVKGSVNGPFQVIHGEQGWLFLDNDSNRSVEQYTGKLTLGLNEKRLWRQYFQDLLRLQSEQQVAVKLLVAPSKEMVYPQYYPHKRARKTAIDQLLALVPDSFPLCFPVSELQRYEQRSFRVCDTHWTLHGARLASMLVSTDFAPMQVLESFFAHDEYAAQLSAGDLGKKVYPPARHSEDVLRSFSYRQILVFDNQLPNFGRVMIMHYPHALLKQRALLFGSSSAYTMFNYLSRIFETLIFVHCAGNIDPALVAQVAPDIVIAQTNARFIVKPPRVGQSTRDYIADKVTSLSLPSPRSPLFVKPCGNDAVDELLHYMEALHDGL